MYEFEKYVCGKENLKEMIGLHGVAIIPGVLDESECDSMVSKMWDFFEHITEKWDKPLRRDDEDTWREFYKLYPLNSMLLQRWGIGHAQAAWDVRQNTKIVEIFADFWGCGMEELLVSFDGASFHLPPEVTKKGWNKSTKYHTDQSYTKTDFRCVQSFVTGLDINDGDATLAFIQGSNKYHDEFAEEFGITDKADWHKLTKEQEQFYLDRGCEKRIRCPKGSLVFWDSRTIHFGIEPLKTRAAPNLRAVIYLCYMPRSLSSKADLKKKEKAFRELRTTNHYPCKIKLFPTAPRSYGGEVPTITDIRAPELTELGRIMAGI